MTFKYLLIAAFLFLSACETNKARDHSFHPTYENCKAALAEGSARFENTRESFKEITTAICEQVIDETEFYNSVSETVDSNPNENP